MSVLNKFCQEVAFLNDSRLETFADQLQKEDHPTVYPQLTCDWFIQGLDYCCSTWRHEFKKPYPVQKNKANGTDYHPK